MSEPNEYYLTEDGAQKLRAELEELEGPKREELSRRLREAIQQGDLSENADYIKSKEDQGFLEGRIQDLKELLANAAIIEEGGSSDGHVSLGSWVTIQEKGGDPEKYQLVGHTEANPRDGRISNESPIGIALLGAEKGDKVTVETPGGKTIFEILKVE